MSSCRGILVAGVTNRARTQMAEGFLRAFTAGGVYVGSGGVHHSGTLHPMAVRTMRRYGIDISSQSPSSLEAARHQRETYDVYISVDAPYHNRRADRFQRTALAKAAEEQSNSASPLYDDPLLAPATPAHWDIGLDAADARQRWELWSPRDPTVFHETSTRRFQDDLYEGEPLFMRLETNPMRVSMQVTERWEVEELCTPFAMERPFAQQQRFDAAGEELCVRAVRLLRRLESHYEERMLLHEETLRAVAERSARVREELELAQTVNEASRERASKEISTPNG